MKHNEYLYCWQHCHFYNPKFSYYSRTHLSKQVNFHLGSSKQLPEGLSGGEDVHKLQGDVQKSSPETEISSSECDAARDEIVSQNLGQPN